MTEILPEVSVIVVTHNSLPALTACLASLKAGIGSTGCELIVVDNSSADSSPAEVVGYFADARIISNDSNQGFAAACNTGAEAARGEYLLFLNPDVYIDPGAIGLLMTACTQNPRAGLVSGRLNHPNGAFQSTCRRFPAISNLVFSRGSSLRHLFGRRVDKRSRYTLPDYPETTAVPAVAATMAMIRRSLFEEVGGFDTRFFLYMEDTDLSLRLHEKGYVNLYVPAAGGVHDWGKGSDAGRGRREWHHHYSLWCYFIKHYPNGFSVVVLPLLLILNWLLVSMLPQSQTKR